MKRLSGHKQRRAAINKRRGWTKRNVKRRVWLYGNKRKINLAPSCVAEQYSHAADVIWVAMASRKSRRERKIVVTMKGQFMVGPVTAWRGQR
jgi:hypothetical protein